MKPFLRLLLVAAVVWTIFGALLAYGMSDKKPSPLVALAAPWVRLWRLVFPGPGVKLALPASARGMVESGGVTGNIVNVPTP